MKAPFRNKRIGFVGAGNMGQALIKGLRGAGQPAEKIRVVEPNPSAARLVRMRYGVRAAQLAELVAWADILVLAVKPQDLRAVVTELSGLLRRRRRRSVVVSIAAGIRLSAIERLLPGSPVVRVMPNLGAKVGQAVSALAYGRATRPADQAIANAIFGCVGETVKLPERLFDVVTAVSGSGPAYFFLIFQALRDAGMRGGLPRAAATRLAVQTALGSAELARQAQEDLDALVAQVASKRGTTQAALEVFRARGLAEILQAGVAAAAARSAELSASLGSRV